MSHLQDLWLHIANVNVRPSEYFTALFSIHKRPGYVKFIPVRKPCETCPHYVDKSGDYVIETEEERVE